LIRPVGCVGCDGSFVIEAPIDLEAIVSVCFAVEARHRMIGVAVRCPGGFGVFFSSNRAYRKLERGISPNARAVVRSIAWLGGAK
jgi:hypothetical protein